jgi:hypothetical protein
MEPMTGVWFDRLTVMPIDYSIDPANGRLLTRADGVVTFHDINAHLDLEERNRDLTRVELIDARNAVANLTPDEVRLLVVRAADMLRTFDLGPTAIVTTDDMVFGMARMYALLAERVGVSAEAFRDVQSAANWLDRFR